MKVVGISMVKDEKDILEGTINRMAQEVDEILVADNGSTDGTRELLKSLPVRWVDDPDPAHYQSRKMTALAARAREEMGATWVVPFDADEVWLPEVATVRAVLLRVPEGTQVVEAMIYEHVPTSRDSNQSDPITRLRWRRAEANPLRKVACRATTDLRIDEGNHFAVFDHPYPLTVTRGLEIRHYPYRTPEQFIRKIENGAAAFAATTGLAEDVGAHWRSYGVVLRHEGPDALRRAFEENYFSVDPEADGLVEDPCPR